MYKKFFKRPLDFLLATFGFILVFPIVFITAIILAISFRESPFFVQRRPGRHEKIFSILKLKTMNNKRDADGNLLPDSERLTPLGVFVRKTSIDELPQLLNVIKGEMSLIGPRPLLIRYLPYYTTEERKRFSARPGITGLAQVSGRNLITWESKFENDVTYVENLSFTNDVKILWLTFQKVLKSADIEVDPNANPTTEAMDLIRQRQPEFQHIQPIS
ncbi:sugar transferase [Maribacter spongiicola]|uniref:sugar transferase n=1 Tax=Maribacter spongiicola TaxID=1206753 RepID=UPI003F951DAB